MRARCKTLLPPHQAQVKDLNEKLQAAREAARSARSKEKFLTGELDRLTSDLQTCKRERKGLLDERKGRQKEMQELQQRNSTFKSALQVRSRAARRRHGGSFNLTNLWKGPSDPGVDPLLRLRSVLLS